MPEFCCNRRFFRLLAVAVWFLIILTPEITHGQERLVKGRVMDYKTGDPVPFANVYLSDKQRGTVTNFNGYFELKFSGNPDSLYASYTGYVTEAKALTDQVDQIVNFRLTDQVMGLSEVVILAGENPAFEILRQVVSNKDRHDKRALEAYQYESYTKIEIALDNISESFQNRKVMRKISEVVDSAQLVLGEDGLPVLPVFISESVSDFYYKRTLQQTRENIRNTKITGVGMEDGSLISQVIGSSFQEYNFYRNWLNIVGKDFISPIADGWKGFYEYDLTDSLWVGDDYCYRLDFFPKRKHDLAFSGTMWITRSDYALKQIDATVSATANLNFVEKIKIQQELSPTEIGPWMPNQTRVLIDFSALSTNSAGLLAKFYTSSKNIIVNQPKKSSFYTNQVDLESGYLSKRNEEFWNTIRHEPLSPDEIKVYAMVDTIKNVPIIKNYTEILKILATGYKKVGIIDVGPWLWMFTLNSVEGARFQSGFRTNIGFSDRWVFSGQLAYGFGDEQFKYHGGVDYIISKRPWASAGVSFSRDIDQVGLSIEDLQSNYIFQAATRFGDLVFPYRYDAVRGYAEADLFKGFTQKIGFKHQFYNPIQEFFPFSLEHGQPGDLRQNFSISEVFAEARYARDEQYVINDNERISLGPVRWPIITLTYTRGLNGVIDGDFAYNKYKFSIDKRMKMGPLGVSRMRINTEWITGTLPFPLLRNHIGNESAFYTSVAYNTMNFSEFVSDRMAEIRYQHFFQGFILNRIPLMKKLQWRLVGSANVLWGNLSDENRDFISEFNSTNIATPLIQGLERDPFVEVGYGLENVFKFFRFDVFHRLTYTDRPDVRNIAFKASIQIIL